MPILPRRRALALPLAAALAPRPSRAAPLAVTDALGRQITLKATPERIVVNFNFEEFTAVGTPAAWDRVVGMSKALWADWRPSVFRRYQVPIPRLAAMPDIGQTGDGSFSVEKVIALRPDLLLLSEWGYSSLKPQVAQLEALGIPVVVIDYNAQLPERHVASTRALGVVTGQPARGEALAALYLDKLADIQRRAARGVANSGGIRPKVYVELGQAGADTVGNTYWRGMWGRMLDLIGAENIAAGRLAGAGNWGPLNPEYVIAANPDAIFIAGSSWVGRPAAVLTGFDADIATTRARLAPYAQRQGWAGLAAIRTGQIFAIEHGLSRALFDYTAMQFIARQLWPAEFAEIDPEAELRHYHAQWLPVAFEGCWMARLTAPAA
ncbi:MAG: ABC transporter substrate-binding protein [Acetobacteraceae bacterium]|nr:ABC transporter substrate-binding protein [Acetobacteraceae bacterium]